jgi:two-component system sensor histidine kinase/response regulator
VTLQVSAEEARSADTEGGVLLRIEVTDTGPGIPAADHARVFMDFEQGDDSARRKHKGTGLGLAIVRHLTGLMNGRYGLVSEPGQGSTFWVQIPLAKPSPQTLDATVRPGIAEQRLREHHSGARVLLVEDEVLNQQVAGGMLKNAGLEVIVADDGQTALNILRTQTVDLVLMDMQMPGMDGPQTTEAIRAMKGKKTLPIVAMTANAFPEDRERCAASGMNDFLPKPFEQKQLLAVVLQWLSKPRRTGKTEK